MSEEFKPRLKEFFECDCYDKDHMIRAEYEIDQWTPKDNITRSFHELNITFTSVLADYQDSYNSNWFLRKKDQIIWRIKNAFRILRTGEIKTEGYFTPCRSWIDEKDNPIEGQFGYQTTKNLAKWLDTIADKIKDAYEKELEEFRKKQSENK